MSVKNRGHIVWSLLFVLLLTLTGLSLLQHTLIHTRIIRARQGRWLAGENCSRALLLCLHHYRQQLLETDFTRLADPLDDFFNRRRFPDQAFAGVPVSGRFSNRLLRQDESLRHVAIAYDVEAFDPGSTLRSRAQAAVVLWQGRIPLSEFPVIIDRDATQPAGDYLAANGIAWSGESRPLVERVNGRLDGERLLVDSLHLSGEIFSWAELRRRLNLEVSNNPIPEGVYVIHNDDLGDDAQDGVAAVFVQGDLQQVVFSVRDGMQVIVLQQHDRFFELRYLPGERRFDCWDALQSGERLFAEKLIVNGSINAVLQDSGGAFQKDARLTLMAWGSVCIRSNLEAAAAPGQRQKTNLTVITCGRDLSGENPIAADLIFSGGDSLRVEATLVSSGKIVNQVGQLAITGSLYARDVDNRGRIELAFRKAMTGNEEYFRVDHYAYVNGFGIPFFQEVADE